MYLNFDDCYWHDSILQNIFIDRSNPGESDTVEMTIDWYDEPASKIVFKNVVLFKATLNFGIYVKETILQAWIATDDPDLKKGQRLNCYMIETNSTGGIIKIIAESVEKVALIQ
ncbi:hypothetical protein [Chitinophaga sp.]|uniref:hypothetical protein n=1 Tax=Chitinophaga sp. TaxID=1869181 RepID=UPI0031D4FE66